MENINKHLPRDVFLYLLAVVVLAMSAISLGMLLFDMVNVYLPDPLRPVCVYDGCTDAVNGEIAMLLVAFPVLVWVWRFLQRDLRANPEKSGLWVRKWLLYLALFVSGITAIVDLIALVRSWLNGELTLSFFLKVLVVLAIALATFYYFLRELQQNKSGKQRFVAWGAIVVVIATLAAGVYTSAPWEARARAADRDRVAHLSNIQSEIVSFWIDKGTLPAALAQLEDPVRGFVPPVDPVTGQPYEYRQSGQTKFELCATFATASRGGIIGKDTRPSVPYVGPYADPYASNWSHGIGRTCFEREIDPLRYPTKKPL